MHILPMPDLYRGEHQREDPAAIDKYLAQAREVVYGARQAGRKVRSEYQWRMVVSVAGCAEQ